MNRLAFKSIFMESTTFNHIANTQLRPRDQSPTAAAARSGQFIDMLRSKGLLKDITHEKLSLTEDIELTIYSLAYVVPANETDGHLTGDIILTHGVSLDPVEALSKAGGELCERFPLLLYKKRDFLIGSVAHLHQGGHTYLDPANLAGFSDRQKQWFPNRTFDKHSIFAWTEGHSLTSNKPTLLPAQLVFWNYCRDYGGFVEPLIKEANTSGTGGYFSLEEALLAGIYELIQRDGFLIYWLNNQPPPRIEADQAQDNELQKLLTGLRQSGLKAVFLDTTSDFGVPSCVCFSLDVSGSYPYIALGAGCGMNPVAVLKHALIESLMIRDWIHKNNVQFNLPIYYQPFRTLGVDIRERAGLWALPTESHKKAMDHFLSGPNMSFADFARRQRHFASKTGELAHVLSNFKSLGPNYDIFYYRSAHKLLREVGYESVHVIIPALLPLYMKEENATLGARRIREVSEKLGFTASDNINPLPHPFL